MSLAVRVICNLVLLVLLLGLPEALIRSHLFHPLQQGAVAKTEGTEQSDDGPLCLNELTTRNLTAGESHTCQIKLKADEYLHAVIEHHAMDLNLSLLDPTGAQLLELDGRQRQPTPVSIIAKTSGIFRLRLRSLEKESHGRYELKLLEVRPATTNDNHRVAAAKLLAEAERLAKDGKIESTQAAINKYQEARAALQVAFDRQDEAYILKRIGDAFQSFSQLEKALDSYLQSLKLYLEVKDRRGEAVTRNEIASIYISLGRNDKALEHCGRAIRLSRDIGDRAGEAQSLNNLGEIDNWSGKLQPALGYYRQALSIWTQLNDPRGQAQTHMYLGYTYSDLGQPREAFHAFNQALAVWQARNDRRAQAIALTATGRLYSRVGESQEALNFFNRALPLVRTVGDPIEEGRILNGMAFTYDQLGERNKAIEYFNQVFPLFKAAGYTKGEATTLYDAGRVYNLLGQHTQALDCLQRAVAISKVVGDRRLEAFESREIGNVYNSLGDKAKALEHYLPALSFWRSGKDFRAEADTLNPMGKVYEELGQRQEAFNSYNRALLLSRKAEHPYGEATALQNIARIERDRGDLIAARARAEETLKVVESLREKVNSQDLRTSYFAYVGQHYEFYIDLLMRLHKERPTEGFDIGAFEASERARARSFLEMLTAARVGFRDKANPALLEVESNLRKSLNDKAARRTSLEGNDQKAQEESLTLDKEIDELTWQLREVESQIRADAGKQLGSLSMKPLDIKAIQQQVLDDNSLLLEYALGQEKSYLWAVTRNEVSSFELPGRVEIETITQKVYDSLIAHQPMPGQTIAQREVQVAKASQELPSQLANLSNILISPVASKLGTKRLLIVPDGALQYIPFQILTNVTADRGAEINTGPRLLVMDHEIVNQPSASALALLISAPRKPASHTVAVLADPVFEADDPRVTPALSKNVNAAAPSQSQNEERAFRDFRQSNGGQIPRLQASRDEADAIMSVTPSWSGLKATDFEASRTTALRPDLRDYRTVHFATHGLLNAEHPELSGIVLSLYDKNGRMQDGFLRLHDIYNMKLPVDLVVLSACNTGLGKDVRGEGLIGLTRGFMYAGARSVVASLWKVDDEATAELMRYFYQFMLADGLTPAAALRQAQLKMLQQKRWESPYYWSGFIIQGRYASYDTPNYFSTRWYALWASVAAAFSISLFFVLKRRRKS